MRVIAGTAKGYSLKYPKEPRIRPTTDMIKEAMFSALEATSTDWRRILDLYAGTGSLGIEALSRGSEEADFVEMNYRCCSIIKDNLKHTGFSDRANVYRIDVSKASSTLNKEYSLIFMDPPYADQNFWNILARIANSDLAGLDTTIVMEHSHKRPGEKRYGNFQISKNLHHGDTCISIFQHCGGIN